MKSIEKLEKDYQKELELAEKHKKNASDLKKEIELLRGNMINKKVNALNLSGAEYDRFMKLLEKDKASVMSAVELITGGTTQTQTERSSFEDEDIKAGSDEDYGRDIEKTEYAS